MSQLSDTNIAFSQFGNAKEGKVQRQTGKHTDSYVCYASNSCTFAYVTSKK
jgi:hypothetical protein